MNEYRFQKLNRFSQVTVLEPFVQPAKLASLLSFLFMFMLVSASVGAEKPAEKKDPYWWMGIKQTAEAAADQVTAPAEDFIPYDWLKQKANQYGVTPVKNRFDHGPVPGKQHGPEWRYTPKSPDAQRIQRNENMSRHDAVWQNNPSNMWELDKIKTTQKPMGSDVAPDGDWVKIDPSAPGLQTAPVSHSWGDWSRSVIKKHLDPSNQAGYLKMLDTAQTFQHLIDCQRKGENARDCLKTYGLKFATSKAATELLTYLGRYGGAHIMTGRAYAEGGRIMTYTQLEAAGLGESVLAGGASLVMLAYADYEAIKKIMECTAEARAWWNAYQEELIIRAVNEKSDESNWDGTFVEFERRLGQFKIDFDMQLEQLGEDLLHAWDESIPYLDELKAKNDAVEKALSNLMTPEDLKKQLKAECKKIRKQEEKISDEQLKALEDKANEAEMIFQEARSAPSPCNSRSKKEKLVKLQSEAANAVSPLESAIKKEKEASNKRNETLKERLADVKRDALQEFTDDETVKLAFEEFEKAYSESIDKTLLAYNAYQKYSNTQKAMSGRLRRLSLFFSERGKEVLTDRELEQMKIKLAGLKKHIENFVPKKRHYDRISSYERDLKAQAEEQRFLDGLGKRIYATYNKGMKEFQQIELKCELINLAGSYNRLEQRVAGLGKDSEYLKTVISNCDESDDERRHKCKYHAFHFKQNMEILAREGSKLSKKDRQYYTNAVNKARSEMQKYHCNDKDLLSEDMLSAQAECRKLPGGVITGGGENGSYKCGCPEQTVKMRTKSRGTFCMGCSQLRSYFDREIADNNESRANKILDKAKGRCLWHDEGREQVNNLGNRATEQLCDETLPGSIPVSGRCECPSGTVKGRTRSRGESCIDCEAMRDYFDRALGSQNTERAEKILNLSRSCSWYEYGNQQINQTSQAQIACDNIQRDISIACGGKQWGVVNRLKAQLNSIPGCELDRMVAFGCSSMQTFSSPAIEKELQQNKLPPKSTAGGSTGGYQGNQGGKRPSPNNTSQGSNSACSRYNGNWAGTWRGTDCSGISWDGNWSMSCSGCRCSYRADFGSGSINISGNSLSGQGNAAGCGSVTVRGSFSGNRVSGSYSSSRGGGGTWSGGR